MAAPIVKHILAQVLTTLDGVATLHPVRTAPANGDEQDGTVVVRIAADDPTEEAEGETQAATMRTASIQLAIVAKSDPDSLVPLEDALLQHWSDAINALVADKATFRALGAVSLWASGFEVFVEEDLALGELDAVVRILYAHAESDPTAKAYN